LAYLGNRPAEAYSAFQKQDFSTSATTSYTLDHPVANQNEIALFINFVRQEPTTAYTASGTSLTLTSATSSSDDMYCIYLGKAVQTVNPPSGSVGSSQVAASIITGQTALGATPADTDELLISDAGTLKRVDYSYLKSANTPAFHAFLSADQGSLSDAATVKMQVNSETYDSDGTYDNSTNYRFTPGVAGKYFIYGAALVNSGTVDNMRETEIYIYKNGSSISKSTFNFTNNYSNVATPTLSIVDVANTTDYYELYAQVNTQNSGNWTALGNSTEQRTYFGAYRIIGV